MNDLNDLYFFAKVAEHRGFTSAGRALATPKSTLSRRIALLEQRLGVRLLHRTARKFSLTEVGQIYYGHCLAMLAEAEAAQKAIDRTRAEPRGMVRVSCPATLMQTHLSGIVSIFLAANPLVKETLSPLQNLSPGDGEVASDAVIGNPLGGAENDARALANGRRYFIGSGNGLKNDMLGRRQRQGRSGEPHFHCRVLPGSVELAACGCPTEIQGLFSISRPSSSCLEAMRFRILAGC